MRIFDKLKAGANRLFDKVKADTPRVLGKISSGLQQGSNILKQGSNIASQVLNSPITQGIATGLGLAPELGGIKTVVNGLDKASQILGKSSRLSDIGTYRGNAQQVAKDLLQRAKDISRDLKDSPAFA